MAQWCHNLAPVQGGPVVQASRLRYPRGFTVLEIVIASSIALVVFAAGYLAISTTTKTGNQVTKIIRDTENARLFFNMLERDMAVGLPGPGPQTIAKYRPSGGLGQDDAYSFDPTPMVITECIKQYQMDKNGQYVLDQNGQKILLSVANVSDILQFYCPMDSTAARDELTLVRYYVNRSDNTLCRKGVVYDPNAVPPETPPHLNDRPAQLNDPRKLTNASGSDYALFDNIKLLTFVFQRWDPVNKRYLREGNALLPINPISGLPDYDSILVTVIFTDDFKQKTVDAYNPDHSTSNIKYQSNLNKTYRSYSKVLQISAAFEE